MDLNGPAWRHYNPILSNYGGLVYQTPRSVRLARPGYAIKSDVNGRNPRPDIVSFFFLEPIRDAPRGGLASFQPGARKRR